MDPQTITAVCAVLTLVIVGVVAIRQGGAKGANNEWQFKELKSGQDRTTTALTDLTASVKALELRGNTQDKTGDNHHLRIRELESDVKSEQSRLTGVADELHRVGSTVRAHDVILKRIDAPRAPKVRKAAG